MVSGADVMTSAFHGRKKSCFTIETGLRPNGDRAIFALIIMAKKMTSAQVF